MPERFAIAVSTVGVFPEDLPDERESVSQEGAALALQDNVPFPAFETSIV